MNQVVMQSIVQMDTETLKRLTTEVKETLATGIEYAGAKETIYRSRSLENTPGKKTACTYNQKMGYLIKIIPSGYGKDPL